MGKVELRNCSASAAGRMVAYGFWAGVWGFCSYAILEGSGQIEHPVVLVPVGLFLIGAVGVLWNLVLLVDRSVKVTIDADGLRDHRDSGELYRWSEVSRIRLRGERRNGSVSFANLTLDLGDGRSREVSIGGLNREPEEVFRIVERHLNGGPRIDPEVAALLARHLARTHGSE